MRAGLHDVMMDYSDVALSPSSTDEIPVSSSNSTQLCPYGRMLQVYFLQSKGWFTWETFNLEI